MRSTRRRGFTLIELEVVVSIIVVLLAVMLPAMIHARSAARRAQCQNNLKQIGLALHMYHSIHDCFPPGYVFKPGTGDSANMSGFGWASMILPFSEQSTLYDTIDFNVPIFQEENAEARAQRISMFECSMDQTLQEGDVVLTGKGYAPSSFVASFGPGDMSKNPAENLGAFGQNSSTKDRGVTDGLSYSFFIGERWNGTYEERKNQGPRVKIQSTWFGAEPDFATGKDNSHLVMFQAVHTPNSDDSDHLDASSAHQTGAHFLMGDGSVHFISFEVEPALYRKLSTIRGGELTGEF
ncbi:MAG: prepilin-type cleavage/methylation domain-containing protein [Planctomycetaceae bacterium]|nr:prepilin-type cleavage/methylation domain-containing protein [Planctomycetaceae bacterium]